MSDFSSDELLKDRTYWGFYPPSSNSYRALPLTYHTRGVLFANVVNNGVVRINDQTKVLILEYITFNSITSDQNGGCVLFNPGHSIYQKDICARDVYSSTKAKYGYINVLKTSENVNYNSMISITDCTHDALPDLLWIGGGKISLSNYNSTNNYASQSPGFYLENSVGKAITSTINFIVCSDTDCILKYSNFYKNKVIDTTYHFLTLHKDTSSVDHCVFAQNIAKNFLYGSVTFTSCSFYQNSFSSTPNSSPYRGLNSFNVVTICHIVNPKDCIKK